MIGLFFEGSHLWGVLFIRYLRSRNLPFKIMSFSLPNPLQDISLILVPGGWASRKRKIMGEKGARAIEDFVYQGGTYLGVCGGAGLALDGDGLGLCPVKRKPMSKRVPNFSGYVKAHIPPHPLSPFEKDSTVEVPVWWPSQFDLDRENTKDIDIVASYGEATPNFWIADLPWWVIEREKKLSLWEKEYRINLDFSLIRGEPIILYGKKQKGRYLLSYTHLESPFSPPANMWLDHILGKFLGIEPNSPSPAPPLNIKQPDIRWEDPVLIETWKKLLKVVACGEENFLLCWRLPWLLGWKRGVPGLSLNSLLVMIVHLLETLPQGQIYSRWKPVSQEFAELIDDFSREFIKYLGLHRRHHLKNPLRPPDHFAEDEISTHIKKLCGPFPGDGGIFKRAGDILEEIISGLC